MSGGDSDLCRFLSIQAQDFIEELLTALDTASFCILEHSSSGLH